MAIPDGGWPQHTCACPERLQRPIPERFHATGIGQCPVCDGWRTQPPPRYYDFELEALRGVGPVDQVHFGSDEPIARFYPPMAIANETHVHTAAQLRATAADLPRAEYGWGMTTADAARPVDEEVARQFEEALAHNALTDQVSAALKAKLHNQARRHGGLTADTTADPDLMAVHGIVTVSDLADAAVEVFLDHLRAGAQ
jgi:hypothetical protein